MLLPEHIVRQCSLCQSYCVFEILNQQNQCSFTQLIGHGGGAEPCKGEIKHIRAV